MNKYYKIFIAFVLVLGLWIGLNGWDPANPLTANAQEPPLGDILEGVLEEVREEIKQDIKTDVRRETSEVVAEELVSPSDSLSGVYVDFSEPDDPVTCSLNFTQSSVAGRCTGENDVATISGSSMDEVLYFFDFQLTETEPPCSGSGTGKFTVVGTGEPGTKLLVTILTDPCGPTDSFILVKQ